MALLAEPAADSPLNCDAGEIYIYCIYKFVYVKNYNHVYAVKLTVVYMISVIVVYTSVYLIVVIIMTLSFNISTYIYTGNMIRANDTIAFRSTARLYCEEFATKTGVQEERSEL